MRSTWSGQPDRRRAGGAAAKSRSTGARAAAALAAALLATACAASPLAPPLEDVVRGARAGRARPEAWLVLAVAQDLGTRVALERALARRLAARGVRALAAADAFDAPALPDRAALEAKVAAEALDAVLLARVERREEQRVAPGRSPGLPITGPAGLHGRVEAAWDDVHRAPVVLERPVARVALEVLDARTARPLWTARTPPHAPDALARDAGEVAEAVAAQLVEDGLLP